MSVKLAPDGVKCRQPGCWPPCPGQAVVVSPRYAYWDCWLHPQLQNIRLVAKPTLLCAAHAELVPEAAAFLRERETS